MFGEGSPRSSKKEKICFTAGKLILCKVGPTLLDDKPSQEARMKKGAAAKNKLLCKKLFCLDTFTVCSAVQQYRRWHRFWSVVNDGNVEQARVLATLQDVNEVLLLLAQCMTDLHGGVLSMILP